MTLRKKLILLYSGLLGIVIVAFGTGVFSVIRSTWIEAVDSTLEETHRQVTANSRALLIGEFGAPTQVGIGLPELDVFRASGVMVQVWSVQPNGTYKLEAASNNLTAYTNPLDSKAIGSDVPHYDNVQINNTEVRVLTAAFRMNGQGHATGWIQIAASLETVNQATGRLLRFMALGGLLAMVASFGLGLVLSNQTLKPIEAITCAAESISSAKDLKTRLTWTGPMDELGRLTMVFNGMMDRLEHLFGAQRRLIADVSHELRTPLTAVRGHLDLIRRYGVDESSLEAIESEAERMSRLVNDLLTLARADYGSVALDRVELDLDTIVTDVYRHAKILAGDRELKIKLTAVEPVRILGDSDRLKQLLLNLIQNSIKFTPDGGQIHISLRREGSKAVLQVGDTGIGIQPDDLQHIFDRFYQADGSRSRANEQDGAGLGLAIAKWIAEAHDGTIEAQSSPGIWTVFTVRLPVAAAQPETQPPAYESSEHTNSSTLQRLGLNRRKHETAAGGS